LEGLQAEGDAPADYDDEEVEDGDMRARKQAVFVASPQ
jgi:hypothetical protein